MPLVDLILATVVVVMLLALRRQGQVIAELSSSIAELEKQVFGDGEDDE